jgi:hypothetical protein
LVSDVGERSGGISVGDDSAVLGYEDLLLVAFFIGYKVIPQPVRCDLNYACLPQLQFKSAWSGFDLRLLLLCGSDLRSSFVAIFCCSTRCCSTTLWI